MKIGNSWTFQTDEVAGHFDEHVREQLPWYDMLSELVVLISRHYMSEKALCYDIGASTGNIGHRLRREILDRRIQWIGIDNAESMRKYYKAPGTLITTDATLFNYRSFDLAICFLSLMFMHPQARKELFSTLLEKIKPGGALIVVDKYEPNCGVLSLAFQRYVFQAKLQAGATADDVLRKELSLCGIQRPIPRNFFDEYGGVEFFRFGFFFGRIFEKA